MNDWSDTTGVASGHWTWDSGGFPHGRHGAAPSPTPTPVGGLGGGRENYSPAKRD